MTVPFVDLSRQHAPLREELGAAFDRVLGASSFVLGTEVEAFEARFAEYCGVSHCVGVGSGTAALTIMLRAAGIGAGDEVIVPAHTFIATALAVMHAGARPICVDVERGTGLIDPAAVRAAVGPRTAAVIAVHLYGQACAIDELHAIAEPNGIQLFEDAAQSQGAEYRGRRAGALGRAAAFSFYVSKNLGALGDAGAICTDDDDVAAAARALRDLGRRDGRHVSAGYNERLDGLQAACLSVKLPHLDDWNTSRRRLAAAYRERLAGGVELVEEKPESPSIHHLFPIRTADRDLLAARVAERGVSTGVHYDTALPDQPALAELRDTDTPVAREWAATELSLPIFAELSTDELETVCTAVTESL